MLNTIREMWRDKDGVGRLMLFLQVSVLSMAALLPVLVWRDHTRHRDAAARFDACVRAGGAVAVSTSRERWCMAREGR